jgi:hypothetical protein
MEERLKKDWWYLLWSSILDGRKASPPSCRIGSPFPDEPQEFDP